MITYTQRWQIGLWKTLNYHKYDNNNLAHLYEILTMQTNRKNKLHEQPEIIDTEKHNVNTTTDSDSALSEPLFTEVGSFDYIQQPTET